MKIKLTRAEKIDATKDAILELLESMGPQSIHRIAHECKEQAYLGHMACALCALEYDTSIYWHENDQVYEVM